MHGVGTEIRCGNPESEEQNVDNTPNSGITPWMRGVREHRQRDSYSQRITPVDAGSTPSVSSNARFISFSGV